MQNHQRRPLDNLDLWRMHLFMLTLLLTFVPLFIGGNLMIGKPSKQSSTYMNNSDYESLKANDGLTNTTAGTGHEQNPYWQCDLQGYYRISTITVTTSSDWPSEIWNAYIGASVLDVSIPGSDAIKCGQWPHSGNSSSRTFVCCIRQPVRFVRIWLEDYNFLSIGEVSVETEPEQNHKALKFLPQMSKRLPVPRTSVTVAMVNECASICYRNQTCTAFSFRQGGQLNCLLGTGGSLTSDPDWLTYDCFNPQTCHDVIVPAN